MEKVDHASIVHCFRRPVRASSFAVDTSIGAIQASGPPGGGLSITLASTGYYSGSKTDKFGKTTSEDSPWFNIPGLHTGGPPPVLMGQMSVGDSIDLTSEGDTTITATWSGSTPPISTKVYVKLTVSSGWSAGSPVACPPVSGHGADDGFQDNPQWIPTATSDAEKSMGVHLVVIDISNNNTGKRTIHFKTHFAISPVTSVTSINIYQTLAAVIDTRGVAISLGYTTYHQTWKVNADGTPFIDAATGMPVGVPEADKTDWWGFSYATIGLPYTLIHEYGDGSGSAPGMYPVQYHATVDGGANYPNFDDNTGDTYRWLCSLHGDNSDAILPNWEPPIWEIDYQQTTYWAPVLGFASTTETSPLPSVIFYDADPSKPDFVKFNYKFHKDGADAAAIMNVSLHPPVDNYIQGPSQAMPDTRTPIGDPNTWYNVGQNAAITDNTTAVISSLGSDFVNLLGLLRVFTGGHPELALFLVASSQVLSSLTPNPVIGSYPDSLSNFQDAVEATLNGDQRVLPAAFASQITDMATAWGQCRWQPWFHIQWRKDVWACDQYGPRGYTGQGYVFLNDPWSKVPENHYQQVSPPTPPVTP